MTMLRRAFLLSSLAALLACRADVRLCGSQDACNSSSACVSGRCIPVDAGVPSVQLARRLVLRPVMAASQQDDSARQQANGEVALANGRAWVLEFEVPPLATVVEAYVLLHAVPVPTQSAIDVHAEEGALRPLFGTRAGATTHVDPPSLSGNARIRVDVHSALQTFERRSATEKPGLERLTLTLMGSGAEPGVSFAQSGANEPVLEIFVHEAPKVE
jgi:hypothetical protein